MTPARARRARTPRRLVLAAALASLSLAASTPAAMAVTIGQIAPAPNPPANCDATPQDFAQPTVTAGNTYVVPTLPPTTSLVISSWSHTAFDGPGQQITMKVWRHVSGLTYRAVAHDGPRTPNPGVVNTFSGLHVPVEPGDVLGLGTTAADNTCIFSAPGETLYDAQSSNAGDGEPVTFFADSGYRANVSAVVEPSNTFTLGATTRDKKRGTATVNVSVPNPGELTGSGTGVNASSAAATSKAVGPGNAQLLVKAKGKKRRKLNQKGKVKLTVGVTYTPSGGQPSTQSINLKLKKNL
jgi:hypothetical protein